MSQTKPHHSDVKAHYRTLAAEYSQRANRTCEQTYDRLVRRFMAGRERVLELGSGSSELLDTLGALTPVACDLSREMLLMRPGGDRSHRVVAVGERLPFAADRFDGAFLINVLEHVADLEMILA
jgi:ubiquinone/menaquinone biosynthesis C-methylase UbiE